jgi:hypothetical protein
MEYWHPRYQASDLHEYYLCELITIAWSCIGFIFIFNFNFFGLGVFFSWHEKIDEVVIISQNMFNTLNLYFIHFSWSSHLTSIFFFNIHLGHGWSTMI